MDAVRDLGRVEPWQDSLERSRARRAKSSRGSSARHERPERRPPARRAATPARRRGIPARRGAAHESRAPRGKVVRGRILVVGGAAVLALALTVAVLPGALAGRGSPARPRAASTAVRSAYGGPLAPRGAVPRAVRAGQAQSCQPRSGASDPVSRPSDYVNPLARARVRPERVDQGVDYAGSGTLEAIGAAKVTRVTTSAAGWPGSFIEYRLLGGSDAGCYVYYAEGVNPMSDLHAGQPVAAGQPIATIIPGWSTGIELGWGAGTSTTTYAAQRHQWSANRDADSIASAAGKSFSALIASLGGPPGKVEG